MSALGHKRTFAVQNAMSALPPKADMCGATRYVRFVPIADISLFMRLRRLDAFVARLLRVRWEEPETGLWVDVSKGTLSSSCSQCSAVP